MSLYKTAIMEMGRQRDYHAFAPSEVVQWIFPQDWKLFLDDLIEEMMELYRQDEIVVTLGDRPIEKGSKPSGRENVKIKVPKPFVEQKVG